KQPRPRAPQLDAKAIAAQNAKLFELDTSVNVVSDMPDSITREAVQERLRELSQLPDRMLYREDGQPMGQLERDAFIDSIAKDAIPAVAPVRFGLVVRRASVRAFPTRTRAFTEPGNTDIDRFQESALFPGTPVAIVHESRDGQWWFVVSPLYVAWIAKDDVAIGSREDVFAWGKREPAVIVTGARVETVYTPEEPRVSKLVLDMGLRVPLRVDWPANEPVNGQNAYNAWVVELPVRNADGSLAFAPALVPRSADVSPEYLPLDRTNVVRQSFKFLGERYGWGHDYGTRDCSGFVSEVYRSFGVVIPRNTSDQATSPALDRVAFADGDVEARRKAVKDLDTGDLVYIPGHVMMVIGKDKGVHYVIHDTTGFNTRNDDGGIERVKLNGVSVTPLETLLGSDGTPYVDRITAIQRIRRTGEGR
ncbi:MAG TPA: SH3 domain-containing protein, partial [Xanthomonadales bacterium]|nr:SH3 domain-containing protein [Xanthomonadales bacterium]